MKHNYTNLEMLVIGIEEIAKNHGFESNTDWEENGEVCIFGGCNVPTLQDVKFLCENIGIKSDCIESSEFGIDVWLSTEWLDGWSQKIYEPMHEFWRKNQ